MPADGASINAPEAHVGRSDRVLRSLLYGAALAAIIGTISYLWIDRPVAVFVHDEIRSKAPVQALCIWLGALPDLLTGLWVLVTLSIPCFLWAFAVRRITLTGRLQQLIIAGSGSFLLASTAKMLLKWSCGRTWPETWIHNNPSFIRDGVYGFFPFHGGAAWSSFPSGHMAAVTTVTMIAWHFAPRLRSLWATIAIAAAIGLVAMNFHFVSDIVVGCYVGAASSAIGLRLAALPQRNECAQAVEWAPSES